MKRPEIEYWNKLMRLLSFMNQKIDNERIIEANNLQEMQTYVDFSHVVHMDMS